MGEWRQLHRVVVSQQQRGRLSRSAAVPREAVVGIWGYDGLFVTLEWEREKEREGGKEREREKENNR